MRSERRGVRMKTTALTAGKDFLRITGDGGVWYGGDQAWFDFTVGKYGGCGTVAAANITAYLACAHEPLSALYETGDLQKNHFCAHMNTLYEWVRPWKIPFVDRNQPASRGFGWTLGVWPMARLMRGVERYARAQGLWIRGRKIGSRRPMGELTEFIRESLRRDCPVAMLIGREPRYEREQVTRPDDVCWMQTHFSMHWVVVTELTETGKTVKVKVTTWGGYAWLDLNLWHEAGSLMAGLVSFTWD